MSLPFSVWLTARAEQGPRVQLDQFEGPLALLWQLIQQQKVDLLDIPVAKIADQYLAHLDAMRPLDPEVAADYLYLAAALLRLKAQMLFPKPAPPQAEADADDPRTDLVASLLEYRRYKMAAQALDRRAQERALLYGLTSRLPNERRQPVFLNPVGQATPADLRQRLLDLLHAQTRRLTEANPVRLREWTLSERVAQVRAHLLEHHEAAFDALCAGGDRAFRVLTFMAILELVRRREAIVTQSEPFGPLWIYRWEGQVGDAGEP